MTEKRRTKRWNIFKDARFRLEGGAKYLNCMVDDISFWGLKISCLDNLEPNSVIEMQIDIPDALNPIIAKAKVVWLMPMVKMYKKYGLVFLDLNEKDREKIYKYIYQSYPHEFKKVALSGDAQQGKGGEVKMEDRRVFARITTNFTAGYLNLHTKKSGQAQVYNISANGVGLVTGEKLKADTPVELWLRIPDQGAPLYTRGKVVWSKALKSREYCSGIALEKADLMGLSRLFRQG